MTVTPIWRRQSPNNKSEIQVEEGFIIADPFAVLRLTVLTDEDEVEFDVYTPCTISGVLDRIVYVPINTLDPTGYVCPGIANVFNVTMTQYFQSYPLPPGATTYALPVQDAVDLLDGNGVGLTTAVVHIIPNTEIVAAGVGPLIQRLFVQDFLKLSFSDWSNGSTANRRADFYIYFKMVESFPVD